MHGPTPIRVGNVTKDRLGPYQGSNARKGTGAGMGVWHAAA